MTKEWSQEYLDFRIGTVRANAIAGIFAAFICGVALTQALDRLWPKAGTVLLALAATGAFINAMMAYRRQRRSRAQYEHSLEQLRAISPEIAESLKDVIR